MEPGQLGPEAFQFSFRGSPSLGFGVRPCLRGRRPLLGFGSSPDFRRRPLLSFGLRLGRSRRSLLSFGLRLGCSRRSIFREHTP